MCNRVFEKKNGHFISVLSSSSYLDHNKKKKEPCFIMDFTRSSSICPSNKFTGFIPFPLKRLSSLNGRSLSSLSFDLYKTQKTLTSKYLPSSDETRLNKRTDELDHLTLDKVFLLQDIQNLGVTSFVNSLL